MRIAIDALSARTGGGVVYLRNLIRSLVERKDESTYIVFVSADSRDKLVPKTHERVSVVRVRVSSVFWRLVYEQTVLPLLLAIRRADVLLAPAEIAPVLSPCPVVLCFQNANIYQRKGIRRRAADRCRNFILFVLAWLSARKARELIFVSKTAQRLVTSALGLDPERGHVVYHGVDPLLQAEMRDEDPHNVCLATGQILCVSSIAPHKNIACLVDAYRSLRAAGGPECPLLIVGPVIDRPYHERISRALRDAGLDPAQIFVGEVPFEKLRSVYRDASLLVFPSKLETFGLPLIEAMASGVPVLAADASCIPEIVGDAAILFNPDDPHELSEAMGRLLADHELMVRLAERGRARAAQFSWSIAAERMLEILQRAGLGGLR
jgi:glycosyltransferase involved in cell wall biosynthesis